MNLDKELQSNGFYAHEGLWYGRPYAQIERFNTPITPKENLLRFYRGEKTEWIPAPCYDLIDLTPHCNPDVDASDYDGGLDAFGVKWIPVRDKELPAFVEPGFILLEDIADWKDMEWPDVDSWDWEGYAKRYQDTLAGDDRMRRGILLSGYFERLISIMSFQEAAVALLTDPDSVNEFFDKLTDLNIQIADHFIDDFGCEMMMIHDDWAAQFAPFFSLSVCMELIVPHLKRLVDHVHSRNVLFILHSCGNGNALIPAIKASGVDGWQAQGDALDILEACKEINNEFVFDVNIMIPENMSEQEKEDFIREMMLTYCVKYRTIISFEDEDPEGELLTRRLIYKVSRELNEKLGEKDQ